MIMKRLVGLPSHFTHVWEILAFSFPVSLGRKENFFANIYICGPFFKMRRRTAGPRGFSSRLVRALNSIVSALHATNTLDTWTRKQINTVELESVELREEAF